MKTIGVIASVFFLSACSASWDMNGTDPYEYYKANPIKNKVESRVKAVDVHFAANAPKLTSAEVETVREALRGISPEAVDGVAIGLSSADINNNTRRTSIAKSLRAIGYGRHTPSFEKFEDLNRDDVRVRVTYLAVVPPACPDWRTSPVTTYSNTHQGNFHCASEVNLGLMVADPHDLIRGPGNVNKDSDLAVKAIEKYRAGSAETGSASSSSSGDTESSGSTSTAPTPQ